MRIIDADALSAFVGDLRSTLHKEQSTFKAMTEIEFNTRDYMLLNFQQTIDNAPTVDIKPFARVTFDKDELEQIVRDRVIEPIKNGELVLKTEERPQGKWIPQTDYDGFTYWKCSECGKKNDYEVTDFCFRCGADMRVKDELNHELNELGGNNESLL